MKPKKGPNQKEDFIKAYSPYLLTNCQQTTTYVIINNSLSAAVAFLGLIKQTIIAQENMRLG